MAIVLGGDEIDAVLTVGPKLDTNGLVFYVDPAYKESLVTKRGVSLTEGTAISSISTLLGDGRRVTFSAATVPYYKSGNGGYLYTGLGTTQNSYGVLSTEVVLGSTYTVDIWVIAQPGVGGKWEYGTYWLTGENAVPGGGGSGRNTILGISGNAFVMENYANFSQRVPSTEWTNVVGVATPTEVYYYVNGVYKGRALETYTTAGKPTPDIRLQLFGNFASYTVGSGDSSLGPVKVYNIALTAQEVLQNYNLIKGRYII